jgi:hypothetical protein
MSCRDPWAAEPRADGDEELKELECPIIRSRQAPVAIQ